MTSKPVVLQLLSSVLLGGQENLLISLLEESSQSQQIESIIVVMNTDIDPIQYDKLMNLGITVYFLNRKQGHLHPKYFLSLLKIIQKHNVRIIHTHDFGAKYWAALCKFFFWNLKLVFTVHHTLPIKKHAALNRFISRNLIDINIAVSDSVENVLLRDKIENTELIPNGINFKKFEQAPKSNFSTPIKLINVARPIPDIKGQDILIDALYLCKQNNIPFHCTFVGEILPCHQSDLNRLEKRVKSYDLSDCVEFLGAYSDVSSLLKSHDLFIFPSLKEAFGLAIIEAMASGIPVIASSTEGPAEILTHNETGLLFETGNAVDLFNKIQFAYLNQSLMNGMAERAHQDAQKYAIQKTLKLHVKLYQDLIVDQLAVFIINLKGWSKNLRPIQASAIS
jgi:glycosyltransferase involved in cell wall biosynthesis